MFHTKTQGHKGRQRELFFFVFFVSLCETVFFSSAAHAEPGFARLYKQQYGYMPSCYACHKDGGGTPVNPFGQQFKDNGKSLAAFAKIGALDADGDGASNEAEAGAKANPGQKNS